MNTSGLSVVITGLDEFTLYEVRVSAVTVEEGPQAVVPVRTDSDGKDLYDCECLGGGGGGVGGWVVGERKKERREVHKITRQMGLPASVQVT